jgi:hypothetical protein
VRPERIGSGARDTVGPVIAQLKNSAMALWTVMELCREISIEVGHLIAASTAEMASNPC